MILKFKVMMLFFLLASCGKSQLSDSRKERNEAGANEQLGNSVPSKTELNKAFDLLKTEPIIKKNIFSRLTNKEYRYVVQDILAGKKEAEYSDLSKVMTQFTDTIYQGIYNNLSSFAVSNNLEKQHLEFSTLLAKHASTSKMVTDLCANKGACFDLLAEKLIPRLWRKPLTTEEKQELQQFYSNAPAGQKEYVLLLRTFLSVYFHNKIIGEKNEHVKMPFQIGSALSFTLTGSFPDQELFSDIVSGSILQQEIARKHIQRMLKQYPDRFAHLFVSQWLSYSSIIESPTKPTFQNVKIVTMTQELDHIFKNLLIDQEPLYSFFNFKYNFVNAEIGKLYDKPSTSAEWQKVKIEDANLFSSAFFSYKFVTQTTNVPNPILRGAWIVKNLLCEEIPTPTSEEIALAQKIVETAEADLKKLGNSNPSPADKMDFYRAKPACKACHMQFDFHGLALENIGLFGKHREKYYTGGDIKIGNKVGDLEFSSSVEYVEKLAKQQDIKLCFMSHLHQYFTTNEFGPFGRKLRQNKNNFTFVDKLTLNKTIEDIAMQAIFSGK